MANFAFITDEALRRSLENDLNELASCHASSAWKAVHVLAGSIIEATLIDYLVTSGNLDTTSANSKSLSQLIELCRTHAILSEKAIELSAIVRSYRNLIHPGRSLRLAEIPTEHSATIARAVIEILVEEVSNKKRLTYGYTAEQVVEKVRGDSSSTSIADYLLRETHATELKRLLLDVLPSTYLDCSRKNQSTDVVERLSYLYRLGIESADVTLRQLVCAKYVSVLKEEPEAVVNSYETGLFRGGDLKYVDERHRPLVIAHLFGTLRQNPSPEAMKASEGITTHLKEKDLEDLMKILATLLIREGEDLTSIDNHGVGKLLYHESWVAGTPQDKLIEALSELKREYKWNDHMLAVLNAMDTVVQVPF